MTQAIINNQLVTVRVLKTRKLFWLFEQVLVKIMAKTYHYDYEDNLDMVTTEYCKWIPKSNLIEE